MLPLFIFWFPDGVWHNSGRRKLGRGRGDELLLNSFIIEVFWYLLRFLLPVGVHSFFLFCRWTTNDFLPSLRFLWKWVLRIKIRTETIVQTKIILIFYYFDATVYFFSRFSVKGVWEGLSEFIQYLIKLALVLTLARQWGIEGSENIYTREAQSQELLDHKI